MTPHLFRHRAAGSAVTVVAVASVWILTVALPHSWPGGLVVQGAVFGSSAGVLALGLVITYRTTRTINFAYGAMGSAAAELGIVCHQTRGLPWSLCILVAIGAGAAIGIGVDLVMRRFETAPRLVVMVASIGLMQLLIGLQFGVAFWSHANPLVTPFDTSLSMSHVDIGATVFTANDLVAVVLAPVAVILLAWFLLRTQTGTAVRALADNLDRAKLLGIPIARLSRLVWVIVGVLAAAVMILNAPSNGLPASPFLSAGGVFMPALAAAVIARMESLPIAFGAGVAIGVFDAVMSYNIHEEALTTVALLVLLLVALLVGRRPNTRAGADESTWSLGSSSRPMPAELADLVEVRLARWGLLALLAGAAVVFPLLAPAGRIHIVAGYVVLGIAVLSVVVLSGWTGTVSLGQMALVGVGAVTAGDLVAKVNLDLFLAMGCAGVAGAVVSVLIGLPALRVRPIFLAVTTLAFAAAVDQDVINPANHPSWIPTEIIRPVLWKRFPLSSERSMYYFCVATLAVVICIMLAMQRSRPRRVLQATRDNRNAAAALAIPVVRTRLAGMAVSGAIAGTAGALWGVLQFGVGSSSFPVQDSITLFSMAVVGGLGSISGSLAGVAATELLLYVIGSVSSAGAQFAPLGTGVLLLGVLMIFPGGLEQAVTQLRDWILRPLAARHGIRLAVGAAAGSVTDSVAAGSVPTAGLSPSPSSRPLLSCRDVHASYGPLQVLFGVNFEIEEGEIVALLGTNGAGKSTIFKTVTGLLPYAGAVEFDGERLAGSSTDAIARSGIAMMPGGRGVFPTLNVAENLRLGCWQLRRDPAAAAAATAEALARFPTLANRLDRSAGNLSGGEQQQLSLAMAFATKPKLLLIDELSLGLAPVIVDELWEKVREIRNEGTTVVLVDQSLNSAFALADRAIFLEKGEVRFEGACLDLAGRPDLLRSVFIGQAAKNPKRTRVVSKESRNEPLAARQRMTGLACHQVSKRFGGITALNKVDLIVPPGRIVGLIGHNGAGKTTLLDVISGFSAPTEGQIVVGGVDVTATAPHRRALLGLGRSFQEARLFPSLTVTQAVMVALDSHLASHDWLAASLGAPPSVDAEVAGMVRSEEILDLLGLTNYAETPVADLSTGTRRLVEIACMLAADPAVLLLDEPTAGVAQKEAEALGPLLRDVQRQTGSAMLMIEHDMALLSSLCDELVAFDQGRVISSGSPADVLADPLVIESYLGTARPTPATRPHGNARVATPGRKSA